MALVLLLGYFVLGAACGGLGTAAGHRLADRVVGASPTPSFDRAVGLGLVVGALYPAVWYLRTFFGLLLPVVRTGTVVWNQHAFAGVVLAGVLLVALGVARRSGGGPADDPWAGDLVLAVTYGVVVAVGYVLFLPDLLALLAPSPAG